MKIFDLKQTLNLAQNPCWVQNEEAFNNDNNMNVRAQLELRRNPIGTTVTSKTTLEQGKTLTWTANTLVPLQGPGWQWMKPTRCPAAGYMNRSRGSLPCKCLDKIDREQDNEDENVALKMEWRHRQESSILNTHWSISEIIWQKRSFNPWKQLQWDDLWDLLGSQAPGRWILSIRCCNKERSVTKDQTGLTWPNTNTWEIQQKRNIVTEPVRHLVWAD